MGIEGKKDNSQFINQIAFCENHKWTLKGAHLCCILLLWRSRMFSDSPAHRMLQLMSLMLEVVGCFNLATPKPRLTKIEAWSMGRHQCAMNA
jgi:hypothetical protein